MYYLGGQSDATSTGVTTVLRSKLNPTGDIEACSATGAVDLPAGAGKYMHSVNVYNNVLYAIGGFEGAQTSSANLRSAVWYSKVNTDE